MDNIHGWNSHLGREGTLRVRFYFFRDFAWVAFLFFTIIYLTMMLAEVPPVSLSNEEATAFQSHQFVKAFITLLVTLCAVVCVHFASRVFLRRLDEEELRRLEEDESKS